MLDEQLIADCRIEGMRPSRQRRTRELVVRLMHQGLILLRDHDFDSLSIEALCAGCDTTVGSFYARFEGKEAFIGALQRLVIEDTRRELGRLHGSDAVPRDSLGHLLNWICKGGVRWIREHEGLVRALLRRASSDRRSWGPLRELGKLQVAYCLPRVLELAGLQPGEEAERRIRFAFQMMYGTLNNMVLINPGPFSLHDAATPRLLGSAMLRLIEDRR